MLTPSIRTALDAGALVLAATSRLAREIRRAYNDAKLRECGADGVWRSPEVMTAEGWMLRLVDDAVHAGARVAGRTVRGVLGEHEERALWERVIAEDAPGTIERPDLAAVSAMEARATQFACGLALTRPPEYESADTRAYMLWHAVYERLLVQEGWIDTAAARRAAIDLVRARAVRLPSDVVLASIADHLSPLHTALRGAFLDAGVRVADASPDAVECSARFVICPSADDELRTAASWARRIILSDPNVRIGVVIPDLADRRAAVERIFADILDPGANLHEHDGASHSFDISLGVPLADVPVVHAALAVLALLRERIETSAAGLLLRSPWIGGARAERTQRAFLDAHLRRHAGEEISRDYLLAAMQPEAGRIAPHRCDDLHARLSDLSLASEERNATAWATEFDRTLRIMGWAGAASVQHAHPVLDSRSWQAAQRFRAVLAEFMRLDRVMPAMTLGDALAQLGSMTARTTFQQEAFGAPVQILGVRESIGIVFDHVWVTGMTADAWPPPARPVPFLPVGLQRAARVPGASPEQSLAEARIDTARLLACAHTLTVSCARSDEDRDLLPSPLWSGVPAADSAEPVLSGYTHTVAASASDMVLEEVDDSLGPPVDLTLQVHGGSFVFSLQSACPFRAFAELRLGSRPLDEIVAGLSPLDRGTLAHEALQRLWSDLGGHAALCAFDEDALAARITAAVDGALAELIRTSPRARTDSLVSVERGRLVTLLTAWMQLEREREPFTVTALEQPVTLRAGELALSGRIDRIEVLASGGVLFVDYKTGAKQWRDWMDARPDEPQLPAYAVLAEDTPTTETCVGIAFANIVRDAQKRGFSGLAARDGIAPGIIAPDGPAAERQKRLGMSWDALRTEWSATLNALAEDWLAGHAEVDPKDPATTCAYCAQQPFCRILEMRERTADARADVVDPFASEAEADDA